MRYRLATLTLLAMLPIMHLMAAPAPDPSAVLDIGPPRKGWSLEKHCKTEIGHMNFGHGMLNDVWCNPEVRKLPSVARFKDARPWLEQNLRITVEDGGRRLRLTFKAGKRSEQVTILNELLRVNLQVKKKSIMLDEDYLHWCENCILELEERIKSGRFRESVDSYRKEIEELRSTRIPACHDEIARLKQFTVIKWAK